MSRPPAAFFSYADFDDRHERGRPSRLRERLSAEVRFLLGEDFPIFQDRVDIQWGENWKARIEESLDAATFLIPIVTPNFFKSEFCKGELERFLAREKELQRNDLVLWVYYAECPSLEDPAELKADPLAQALNAHQRFDWRDLRHEDDDSKLVGKALEKMARQIGAALKRTRAADSQKALAEFRRRVDEAVTISELTGLQRELASLKSALADAQEIRNQIESKIKQLEILADFRQRLISYVTDFELRRLQHEIDAFLSANPGNVDAKMLLGDVKSARQQLQSRAVAKFQERLAADSTDAKLRLLMREIDSFLQENPANVDARILRDQVESAIRERLATDALAEFRRRLLAASTVSELTRLQHEIDSFLSANPANTEARELQQKVVEAKQYLQRQAQSHSRELEPAVEQPPRPSPARMSRGILGLGAIVIASLLIWLALHQTSDSVTLDPSVPAPSPTPVASSIIPSGPDFETITLGAHGDQISRSRLRVEYFSEDLKGVPLEMVNIPGGSFTMGSPKDEAQRYDDEGPQHPVKVATFFIGRFEITRQQWRQVARMPPAKIELREDPSHFNDSWLQPVEQVSWDEANEFCERLRQATKKAYRLPTEAEWEYAARGGTPTPFAFGETITSGIINYNGKHPYGFAPEGNYLGRTVAVGSLRFANGFGIYDMLGNVSEWCADVWHQNYEGAPGNGSAWTDGGEQGNRVLRGGSRDSYGWDCRSATRFKYEAGDRSLNVGFRVVLDGEQ